MVTYKDAGVDIAVGSQLVEWLKERCPEIGGFGGLYPLGDQYLVAGTDGVGTKLKVAFECGIHDTVGIDLVAMSVNDVVTTGARPLFFLDYLATSRLDLEQAQQVLEGVVVGCRQAGCALLGGETAEMPGFYGDGEYDLSGCGVGIVDKERLVDGSDIAVGDVVVGLPSSGLHSNGYSLVRYIMERSGAGYSDPFEVDCFQDQTLGEVLMTPTRIYVREVLELCDTGYVRGISHITGGGLTENIPRMLPEGCGVELKSGAWNVPPIFRWIQQHGHVDDDEMLRTFNMGVGLVLVIGSDHLAACGKCCPELIEIGSVVKGGGVQWV